MKKPLLCLLRRHQWHNRFNDEGQRFQTCDRCGKYRDLIHLANTSGVPVEPGADRPCGRAAGSDLRIGFVADVMGASAGTGRQAARRARLESHVRARPGRDEVPYDASGGDRYGADPADEALLRLLQG
jgi:hypothetical protein